MNVSEREKIKQILEKREITYLFHFTRLENLDSILENGLYSHAYLCQNEIQSVILDNVRADNARNGICLSVSFPNNIMFYSHRMRFGGNWVVVVLKAQLLYEITNREIVFFDTNAAFKKFRNMDINSLRSSQALESLFLEPVENNRDGQLYRHSSLLPKDPTDVQAEIMVAKHIETKYISHVLFDTQTLAQRYKNNFPNSQIEFKKCSEVFDIRERSRSNNWDMDKSNLVVDFLNFLF